MDDEPRMADSAFRHGISVDDIRHAVRHPVLVIRQEEGFVMVIGAARSGLLLEIGFVEFRGGQMIVHAMRARRKFMR
ncbi:MAG: hypothetical protein WCP26_06990 [Actinomycetes bacterium]